MSFLIPEFFVGWETWNQRILFCKHGDTSHGSHDHYQCFWHKETARKQKIIRGNYWLTRRFLKVMDTLFIDKKIGRRNFLHLWINDSIFFNYIIHVHADQDRLENLRKPEILQRDTIFSNYSMWIKNCVKFCETFFNKMKYFLDLIKGYKCRKLDWLHLNECLSV